MLGLNVVLIVAALATAAGLGYAYEAVADLPRISFDEGVLEPAADSDESEAVNVLLVGTDSAAGLDADDPAVQGRASSSQLADVIMILRLEPDSGNAAVLSLPRDLWVPIAGEGSSDKINEAFAAGGPTTLIETITGYLDIPIHHFVAVDFAGFKEIIAAIGGVEVHFPHPARDEASGLFVGEAGCQLLDADAALAYARARHYETRRDGEWVPDNRSDFGRIRRQQEFMQLALSRAFDRGVRNPATLHALINAVDGAVLLDDRLSTSMILDIANAFRLFNPESLGGYTLEDFVTSEWNGGKLALELQENAAAPVLDLFRGTEGLDPTPATVRVRVLNGSGEQDQAAEVASDLRLAGFTVRSTDNARDALSRTEVRYAPGQRASAELLARHLAAPPVVVEDRELANAPVALVTGADYAGLLAEPRDLDPGRRTTTSSTAPSTTVDTEGSTESTAPASPAPEAPSC